MIQKGIGNTFEQSHYSYPTFELIYEEISQNKPMILNINFYKENDIIMSFMVIILSVVRE